MNHTHYDHKKLVQIRESKGLTQQQVAESLSVARNTISRAELGSVASYDLLVELSRLYEIAITDLLYAHPQAVT